MESRTGITVLDQYLKRNGLRVRQIKVRDYAESKVNLAPNTTNTLLSESAGADEIMLVHSYAITSSQPMNLIIRANNEEYLSTTELAHEFTEPILVEPLKSIEITESHTTSTIPARVLVKNVVYKLESGPEVIR